MGGKKMLIFFRKLPSFAFCESVANKFIHPKRGLLIHKARYLKSVFY